MLIHILGIVLLGITLTTSSAEEYLTKKPDVLVPCSLDDVKLDACLAKNIQTIFINWPEEIPGKEMYGLKDPLTLDAFNVSRLVSFNGGIRARNHYENLSVKGLSKAIISEVSYNDNKRIATVTLNIPKLILNYDLASSKIEDGEMSSFEDKVQVEMGLLLNFDVHLKPRVTSKVTFLDAENIKINKFVESDYIVHTDTIKEINMGKSGNNIIAFFGAFSEQWAEPQLLKRANKILNYIPANFIIKNIQ